MAADGRSESCPLSRARRGGAEDEVECGIGYDSFDWVHEHALRAGLFTEAGRAGETLSAGG